MTASRRSLALVLVFSLAFPALPATALAQDEGQEGGEAPPPPPDGGGGGESAANVPVVENSVPDGQQQPDGAENSGGGEVIAGGEIPPESGPDSGGLVEGEDGEPKPKARPRKAKKGSKARRRSAAIEAAVTPSPLIPSAKVPLERIKPIEPLPVVALSPIAPYNP